MFAVVLYECRTKRFPSPHICSRYLLQKRLTLLCIHNIEQFGTQIAYNLVNVGGLIEFF